MSDLPLDTVARTTVNSAEDALRLILKVTQHPRGKLPCRVDEMSAREYEIFNTMSQYSGGIVYIQQLAMQGLLAEGLSIDRDEQEVGSHIP